MPNEDPSNASRRRKREARKALSLSLPDKEKESVHGIIRPILSERKRKASIGLFETRLLPLRGEERQERGDYFNKATSSGILYFRLDVVLYFIKDVLLYFYLIFHRTLLHSINLLILILPPLLQLNHQQRESRHYYRMIDVQRIL